MCVRESVCPGALCTLVSAHVPGVGWGLWALLLCLPGHLCPASADQSASVPLAWGRQLGSQQKGWGEGGGPWGPRSQGGAAHGLPMWNGPTPLNSALSLWWRGAGGPAAAPHGR